MYEISMVASVEELQEAWGLLYQQYLNYNLIDKNYSELWAFPHYFTKHAGTWVGKEEGFITSTTSCLLDKENLLPLDNYYPDELNQLRLQGAKLAECGLLARKQGATNSDHLLVLQCYALAFGLSHGYFDFVIGIHPRQAGYYKRYFGFNQIGEEKQYIHLNNAPVALLYLSLKNSLADTPSKANIAIQVALQQQLPLRSKELCAAFQQKLFTGFKSFYFDYINQKDSKHSFVY
jgi:hypothetical protein